MARARRVAARTWGILRTQGWFLLKLSALVFVPLGLLGTLDQSLPDLDGSEGDAEAAGVLAAVVALSATNVVGQLLFAGVIAAAVVERRDGVSPSIASVARNARWGTLIAIDLLTFAGIVVGLVLLIVPALVFLARYGLAATVSDLERCGIREAFRRSAEITRGHRVLVLVVLLTTLLISAAFDSAVDLLVPGTGFLAQWLAASISGVVTNPIFAVAAVALVLELCGQSEGSRTTTGIRRSPARSW